MGGILPWYIGVADRDGARGISRQRFVATKVDSYNVCAEWISKAALIVYCSISHSTAVEDTQQPVARRAKPPLTTAISGQRLTGGVLRIPARVFGGDCVHDFPCILRCASEECTWGICINPAALRRFRFPAGVSLLQIYRKKAVDPDGMDTYARSAAPPCYWSLFAVSSAFNTAPPTSPRSPAATRPPTIEPKQAAWGGLIRYTYPCCSSGSPSPATPRVWIPCRTRLTDPPWWLRARCSQRLRTSQRSRTVWMSKFWTCGRETAGVWSGSSSSPWGNLARRLRAPKWRRITSIYFSWTQLMNPWFLKRRLRP